MLQDTVKAAGLPLSADSQRTFEPCGAPLEPGETADNWTLNYPAVTREEARSIERKIYDYWKAQAPGWSRRSQEVHDDGIDTKNTPAVNLNIDGFSLGAWYQPGRESPFQQNGVAPCADNSNRQPGAQG